MWKLLTPSHQQADVSKKVGLHHAQCLLGKVNTIALGVPSSFFISQLLLLSVMPYGIEYLSGHLPWLCLFPASPLLAGRPLWGKRKKTPLVLCKHYSAAGKTSTLCSSQSHKTAPFWLLWRKLTSSQPDPVSSVLSFIRFSFWPMQLPYKKQDMHSCGMEGQRGKRSAVDYRKAVLGFVCVSKFFLFWWGFFCDCL